MRGFLEVILTVLVLTIFMAIVSYIYKVVKRVLGIKGKDKVEGAEKDVPEINDTKQEEEI